MTHPDLAGIARPWSCPSGSLVCSVDVDLDVWRAERRKLLGASDVAVLFGHGYKDEFGLWADKTGRLDESPETESMARGRAFEREIIKFWAERQAPFPVATRRQGLMRSRAFPNGGATVDSLSICPAGKCLIEAKVQSSFDEWFDDDGNDTVPTGFQFQGQWQLAVTGRGHIHFVALGPRFRVQHRRMDRDEELIRAMFTRADHWWDKHIVADVPPAPSEKSTGLPKQLYRDPVDAVALLPDEDAEAVRRAQKLYVELAALKAEYDGLVALLQTRAGNASELAWPDGTPIASWKPGKQIDGADQAWQRRHPEWFEDFSQPARKIDNKGLAALIEEHPEALTELRYRRTWTWSG